MKLFLVTILTLGYLSMAWASCMTAGPDLFPLGNGNYEVTCPHADFLLSAGQWRVASNCHVCICTQGGLKCCTAMGATRRRRRYRNGCVTVPARNECGFRVVRCRIRNAM